MLGFIVIEILARFLTIYIPPLKTNATTTVEPSTTPTIFVMSDLMLHLILQYHYYSYYGDNIL